LITSQQELTESLERSRNFEHRHLGQILFQTGILTSKQLKEALLEQSQNSQDEKLGRIIHRLGFANDHQIKNALAFCLEIPFIQLNSFDIDTTVLKYVPAEFARNHSLIPLMVHHDKLVVAMEDPSNVDTLNMLHFMSSHVIEPVLGAAEDMQFHSTMAQVI